MDAASANLAGMMVIAVLAIVMVGVMGKAMASTQKTMLAFHSDMRDWLEKAMEFRMVTTNLVMAIRTTKLKGSKKEMALVKECMENAIKLVNSVTFGSALPEKKKKRG